MTAALCGPGHSPSKAAKFSDPTDRTILISLRTTLSISIWLTSQIRRITLVSLKTAMIVLFIILLISFNMDFACKLIWLPSIPLLVFTFGRKIWGFVMSCHDAKTSNWISSAFRVKYWNKKEPEMQKTTSKPPTIPRVIPSVWAVTTNKFSC